VLVRSGNVIRRNNDEKIFSNAKAPDMDLNVIESCGETLIVNVKSYKGVSLMGISIVDRMKMLSDTDLENLEMKAAPFYTFSEVYPYIIEELIYRHVIDDTNQGVFTKMDIQAYRQHIMIVVALEEAKKQKIELPCLEMEAVLIRIDLQPECKMKFSEEKQIKECIIECKITGEKRQELLEVERLFEELLDSRKKQKKNKKKLEKKR